MQTALNIERILRDMPKGEIALRKEFGDMTFETAVRLLDMNAIVEKVRLNDSAYYAR